jgi:hypothetical protein
MTQMVDREGTRHSAPSSRRRLLFVLFTLMLAAGALAVLAGLTVLARGPAPTPTPAPYIQLSPQEGQPGTLVTVTGGGWQPGDTVFVRAGEHAPDEATEPVLAFAIVAADGRFTVSFTFPADTPWAGLPRVLVTASAATGGDEAFAVLTVSEPDQTPTPEPTASPSPEPTASPTPTPTETPGVTPSPTPVAPVITDWRGEYYSNRDLAGGPVLVRNDAAVDFNWQYSAPAAGIPTDGFSARWSRTVSFQAGTYRFYARSDDGVRVWLDGEPIINEWHDAAGTTYVAERALTAGTHTLRVEYYESGGVARIHFWWERTSEFPQWRGEYFSNVNLSGTPTVVRNDSAIDFNWESSAPAAGIPTDNFSARWTRLLPFEEGRYRFHALVDDSVRLYVDNQLVVDAWQDGARREVTGERNLSAGNHSLRVEYYERAGNALIRVWWEKLSSYPDWKGEYWSNRSLRGSPVVVRNDAQIAFNWGRSAPATGVPADDFSARWTRSARFDAATYRFHVVVDDGARLWVDDRLIIDTWRDGAVRERTADRALTQGTHTLRVEFYERTGEAQIHVWWEKVSSPSYPDWKGEYWSNRRLRGDPALVRNDAAIDFQWGTGAPATGLPADEFSVRWSRRANFQSGVYRFYGWADDGIRIRVDGNLVVDEWHDSSGDEVYMADVTLSGQHRVVVEYYERGGKALAKVWWRRVGDVPGPNRPPVAVDDSATTAEDIAVNVNVLANDSDADGDTLTVSGYQTASAQGGTVSCTSAGVCTYTPPANFNGADTFTYTASDGKGGSDSATVAITVNPVNDPPVAVDDTATTDEDSSVEVGVLANDSDPDGDTLTISAYQAVSNYGGTVSCTSGGACTYTPRVGFDGIDTFTYTVSDGSGGSATATVTVTVNPVAPPLSAVRLNEILPQPATIDWDQNGVADERDEWVELYNSGTSTVDLSGWSLDDGIDGGTTYTILDGTVIGPGGFAVFFRKETGLVMDDSGGEVRLLGPEGTVVDTVTYGALAPDVSYSRDAAGFWHPDWLPSPGMPDPSVLQAPQGQSSRVAGTAHGR